MYSTYLFDLDGTLMDTSPGIFYTANYTMEALGLPRVDDVQLRKFVGPPLTECFRVACGLDDRLIPQACLIYRDEYERKGRFMAQVYEGIPEVLASLRSQDVHLAVATLKLESLAHEVLEYFGIYKYFDIVIGADHGGSRTKADIIDMALTRLKVQDKSSALMIGDTPHDMIGAQTSGVDLLAVDYGFGFPRGVDLSQEPGVIGVATQPSKILSFVS